MKMKGQAALPEQEIRAETLFTRLRVTQEISPGFRMEGREKRRRNHFCIGKDTFP